MRALPRDEREGERTARPNLSHIDIEWVAFLGGRGNWCHKKVTPENDTRESHQRVTQESHTRESHQRVTPESDTGE